MNYLMIKKNRKVLVPAALLFAVVLPFANIAFAEESDLQEGVLNFIHDNNTVVVDDRIFTMDNRTRLYAVSGSPITINTFSENEEVAFRATDELVLEEMRKVEGGDKNVDDTESQETESERPEGDPSLRLENGVWVN